MRKILARRTLTFTKTLTVLLIELLIATIVWGYGFYYTHQQYARWYSEGQSYWEWSSGLIIIVLGVVLILAWGVFFGKFLREVEHK